ncbi:MAG: class I SAM-dependent methyltransferase [Pyrobaculum sp.]|jgi:SAM-dependent methyltransferase
MEDDKYVVELYRNLSQLYEDLYGGEQKLKYWLISSQIGGVVVDAGCGVGIIFEYVKDYVICLDISIDMLEIAKAKRGDMGELLVADYRKPPLRESSVDVVLFLSSADPASWNELREIWRKIASRLIFEFRGVWSTT